MSESATTEMADLAVDGEKKMSKKELNKLAKAAKKNEAKAAAVSYLSVSV